ncbi:MAG TPA: xanthine dehydrogenase [Xanthomonadaceae bacterium]|nr:xanthine dehydrogenase [Xanthomonadaceae bacterium]
MEGARLSVAASAPVAAWPLEAAWPAWPAYALSQDLLPVLSDWHRDGHAVALATLMEVRGSSPRPPGSEMAVRDDGRIAGYVSGGCVEAAVAHEALAALADGRPRWLRYGEGSEVLDIQLGCGGGIGILVRPMPALGEYLARWRTARRWRRTLHVAIDRRSGRIRFPALPERQPGEFLQRYPPPPRLVLVGADPAILPMVAMAAQLGVEVRVIRPHGPGEPPPGLRSEHYDRRSLEQALAELELDRRCALYSLSHDAATDLQVIRKGLDTEAACIGVLGSRSKRAARLRQLRTEGYAEAQLARLRLPAGQRLGPSSPHTIALGIVGEALQAVHAAT